MTEPGLRAGARLGPFVLDGPIAAGGMGRVWAAHHRSNGLPVAIKVLAGARSPRARAALWAEARAVARIDHPGVIRLLDLGEVGEPGGHASAPAPGDATEATAWTATAWGSTVAAPRAGGSPFLVMERADGTLADRLPLPAADALDALRAVLRALAAAHAKGIVHRDVKPANVLRIGGRWVLADFGIAGALDGVAGAASGTARYMAPEQIAGDLAAQGPWTDLYGVGCLAHAVLTGRPPFHGASREAVLDGHRYGRPPPLPSAPELPLHFPGWVDRLLAKDPARRFRCAADALAALDGHDRAAFAADWRAPGSEPPFELIDAGLGLYAHRQAPLVGRRDERARLWAALGEVHATGDMRVAMAIGAPGVGKSRLAQWLAELAAERGLARVVHQVGDAPLGQAVRRALNLTAVEAGRLPAAVARALSDADPTPEEVAAIARLVADALDGESAGRSRAAAMAGFLGLWAIERPVIWWIDDATLAAEALDALQQCLDCDDGAGLPVLVVVTARDGPTERPPGAMTLAPQTAVTLMPSRRALLDLMRRPGTLALPLEPLPPLDARRLVRELLHLDGGVADDLERRAAGHPGFAVRWVADRIEQGHLVPGPVGFRPAPGVAVEVPLDLAGVWTRRVAALARDEGERRLLELAAALGPDVDRAAWLRAATDRGAAERLEARLMRLDVVRAEGPGRWRFTHSPLVEAIGAAAVRGGRWRAINRAAADALLAGDDDPPPALLARLLRIGGRPQDAIAPLLVAAQRSIDDGAYGAALAWLDERAALLEGPDPARDRVAHLRIRALRKLQRSDEALALAEALWVDPPADPALRVRIAIDWSAVLRQQGRLDEGRARIEAGLDEARAVGDPHLITAAATTLGRQLMFAGMLEEAEPIAVEGLEAAITSSDRASALYGVGLLACRRKQWDRARAALIEGRELWRAEGFLHGVSDMENQLADAAREAGDLDAADGHYARSIQTARLAGISIAVPLLNQGFLALEREQAEEARRLLRRAAAALLRERNALGLAFARVGRLQAAAMLGDREEWAAALAMRTPVQARGWPELFSLLDEAAELAEAAGFDPAPVRALHARWSAPG